MLVVQKAVVAADEGEAEQYVSYKEIHDFGIDSFRDFVKSQVVTAQHHLEELLLLHPKEEREDVEIDFYIHRIVDNTAENRDSWNFLQHSQNCSNMLPDWGH